MPGDNNGGLKTKYNETAKSENDKIIEPKTAVKSEQIKIDETAVKPIINEKIEALVEPKIENVVEVKVEPNLEPLTEVKEEKFDVKETLKTIFNNVMNLCCEMYNNVFSKSEKFRPTLQETKQNLLLYIGYKSNKAGILSEFEDAFGCVDISKINAPFVPYIIKLSKWYDAKFNSNITGLILKEFNTIFTIYSNILDFSEIENFINNK